MHCSSFEPLLDEYVDGALTVREHDLVGAHVAGCADCASVLEELRVIDALLLTPRTLEPAPNFTFKAMAEVRSAHPPVAHHIPTLPVVGAYLAFAWTTIALFFLFGGASARGAVGWLRGSLAHYSDAFNGLTAAATHLFGSHTLGITAAMSALLAVDAVAALCIVAYLYLGRRPRRVESGEAL